ncbi:MAG: A/G-specific adenine glycosylase [Spirochaetia bacterium]|nr:A/G-specific adenine glycosylase [Spirochaetia bacterium]
MRTEKNRINLRPLYTWYKKNARALPFRGQKDPYVILVSEIMLQQTRVAAMIPRFLDFTAQFGDFKALAQAPEERVLAAWKGLGYYSRARNLKRAAGEIIRLHNGEFPDHFDEAVKLPGVGPYTAAAVLSIARDIPVAVVDGNVKRVLTRYLYPDTIRTDSEFRDRAQSLLQHGGSNANPGLHNQAVMELGALVCLPSTPQCSICPLRATCGAFHSGGPDLAVGLTAKKKPPQTPLTIEAFIIEENGNVLLEDGAMRPILKGHWFFPSRISSPSSILFESPGIAASARLHDSVRLPVIRHSITKYKVSLLPLIPLRGSYDTQGMRAVPIDQLEEWLATSAALKVLRAFMKVYQK